MPDQPIPTIQDIAVEKIKPSPTQTRKDFNPDDLKGLADSIRQRGLLQPIMVRPIEGGFELIDGERRLRAVQLLGSATIHALVEAVDPKEAALRCCVANAQRKDLDPIEQARSYKTLSDPPFNLGQEEVLRQVGITDRSTLSRYLSLLDLPAEVQEMLHACNISMRQALEVGKLPDQNQQIALAKKCAASGLAGQALENEVKQLRFGKGSAAPHPAPRQVPGGGGGDPPLKDPFERIWSDLSDDASAYPNGWWEAAYGPVKAQGQKDEGWTLKLTKGEDPQKEVAAFFRKAADWIERLPRAELEARGNENSAEWAERMQALYGNIRLPKTPQEQTELNALASKGPAAVVAWIYGRESLEAKQAEGKSWKDMEVADPVRGVKDMVALAQSMKQLGRTWTTPGASGVKPSGIPGKANSGAEEELSEEELEAMANEVVAKGGLR